MKTELAYNGTNILLLQKKFYKIILGDEKILKNNSLVFCNFVLADFSFFLSIFQ